MRDRLLGSATNFGTFLIDRSVLRDAWRERRRFLAMTAHQEMLVRHVSILLEALRCAVLGGVFWLVSDFSLTRDTHDSTDVLLSLTRSKTGAATQLLRAEAKIYWKGVYFGMREGPCGRPKRCEKRLQCPPMRAQHSNFGNHHPV